jgi:hypothetical protein
MRDKSANSPELLEDSPELLELDDFTGFRRIVL